MEINRTSKRTLIGFHFEAADYQRWGKELISEFLAALKDKLPREAWNYNGGSQWWSLKRAYEAAFDDLRVAYFKDERQGGLFD